MHSRWRLITVGELGSEQAVSQYLPAWALRCARRVQSSSACPAGFSFVRLGTFPREGELSISSPHSRVWPQNLSQILFSFVYYLSFFRNFTFCSPDVIALAFHACLWIYWSFSNVSISTCTNKSCLLVKQLLPSQWKVWRCLGRILQRHVRHEDSFGLADGLGFPLNRNSTFRHGLCLFSHCDIQIPQPSPELTLALDKGHVEENLWMFRG